MTLLLSRQVFNLPHYGLSSTGGQALGARQRPRPRAASRGTPARGSQAPQERPSFRRRHKPLTSSVRLARIPAAAAALRFNNTVTELLISGNGLGNVGIEHICNAVGKNTTIHRLDLSRNNGGVTQRGAEKAAAAIAGLLTDNATLTALNISGNNMGDVGMKQARVGERSGVFQACSFAPPLGCMGVLVCLCPCHLASVILLSPSLAADR